jgi:hypothetical protein
MKWVTREKAKVDRIASPWLIKRFIDRDAEFLFVSPDKVLEVADREDAIPFDVQVWSLVITGWMERNT